MAKEFIIENVNIYEREKLGVSLLINDITWYIDDLLDDQPDIIVEGTEEDADKLLKIMGRK